MPAALYKAMGGFATAGVNITKLESYMEDGAWTATMLYAEADGRPEDRGLALASRSWGFSSEKFEVWACTRPIAFRDRPVTSVPDRLGVGRGRHHRLRLRQPSPLRRGLGLRRRIVGRREGRAELAGEF